MTIARTTGSAGTCSSSPDNYKKLKQHKAKSKYKRVSGNESENFRQPQISFLMFFFWKK